MRSVFLLPLCAVMLAGEPAPATAAAAVPAPVTPALGGFLQAVAGAPAIQAAQERLGAARRSAGSSGRLADPMLGAGYSRKTTAMDRWPMYEVRLEQALPRWGERDARRAKALAETAMTDADLRETIGDMAAEVAGMLAEAEAARAKAGLAGAQIARAEAVQTILVARVASGTGGSAEQLEVKSRLAALAVERDTMLRMAADAEQDVRGRLGLPPSAPLPAFAAPDAKDIAIERVPGVAAAQAKSADADAMFHEARASRYPETALGVRYEREFVPGDAMTTVGLELRVSLPVWQSASGDQELAAVARRRAAQREADAWQFRARALLGRAERATAVAATARTAAEATKGRITAEYDALVQAATAQTGPGLTAVLGVLDRLGEAERQVIDAEAAARQAAAGLWRLAPPVLPPVLPTSVRVQP